MTKFARVLLLASFTTQAVFAQSNGYQPGSAIHFGDTSKYLNQTHSSSPAVSTPSTTTFTAPKSSDSAATTSTSTIAKPAAVKRNGRYYRTPPSKAPLSTASITSSSAKQSKFNKSASKDMMREDSASSSSSASTSSAVAAPASTPVPDPQPTTVETSSADTSSSEQSASRHHVGGPSKSQLLKFGKSLGGLAGAFSSLRGGNYVGGVAGIATAASKAMSDTVIKPDAPPVDYNRPVPQDSRGDVEATTSTSATIIKKEKAKPLIEDNRPIADKWAIVMGVSKFKDPTIPPLHYAAKDAKDFADFLVKDMHFAPDHVRLLLNEKATKGEFLAEIGDKFLPRVVHRDDLVILFFSSHGTPADKDIGGSNFVAAYDTDKNSLYSTGIEMQELTRILRERTPKANGASEGARVCIFMDACHSGGGADNAKDADPAGIAADKIDVGRGQILVSSSSGSERSWESKRYANGVFTHNLMASLRGNVGVLDAVQTVTQKISDEVQQDYATTQTVTVNSKMWQGKKLVLGSTPANPQPLPPSVAKLLGPDSHGQK